MNLPFCHLYTTPLSRNGHSRAGFGLTEAAIIVGIVGLILGGIWAGASAMYKQKEVDDIEKDMRIIQNNAFLLYRSQGTDDTAGGTNYSMNHYSNEIKAGVFPSDFLSSNVQEQNYVSGNSGAFYLEMPTAWNYIFWDGYYQANEINGGPATNAYIYEEDLINIPDELCTRLVIDFSSGAVPNVVDVYANATEFGSVYGGSTPFTKNISAARASQACHTGAQNASQVWVMFSSVN